MGTGLHGPHTLYPHTAGCRQDRTCHPLRNSRPWGQCFSHTTNHLPPTGQQVPTDCSIGSEGPTVTSQKPCSLRLLHPKAGAEWGQRTQNGGYENLTPVPNTCQTITTIKKKRGALSRPLYSSPGIPPQHQHIPPGGGRSICGS